MRFGLASTGRNGDDGRSIAETVPRLVDIGPALIVLEATGGYETALVAALAAAGLPVVVANPRQVWDVAKATGRLAKTDRLDAAVLALFCRARGHGATHIATLGSGCSTSACRVPANPRRSH